MDNEYGSMFKRLINERNELRKYIIDICNLLYIDTSQSVLGANCLEFYAVLCNTAENKIKDLQEQLKRKERECEELKKELQAQRDFTAHEQKLIYCVAYDETCKTGNDCKQKKCIFKDNIKLKQTLTEIIRFLKEDKKFARYSGYPIVFTSIVLEEIEKHLKENDIKINECEANQ